MSDEVVRKAKPVVRKASRQRDTATTRAGALAAGLKYYTGPKCEHGHSGKRYASSGHCVECRTTGTGGRGALPALDTLYADRALAEATGATYYRGNICRAGHVLGIRYVKSGHCVECARKGATPDNGEMTKAAQANYHKRRMHALKAQYAEHAARLKELEGE